MSVLQHAELDTPVRAHHSASNCSQVCGLACAEVRSHTPGPIAVTRRTRTGTAGPLQLHWKHGHRAGLGAQHAPTTTRQSLSPTVLQPDTAPAKGAALTARHPLTSPCLVASGWEQPESGRAPGSRRQASRRALSSSLKETCTSLSAGSGDVTLSQTRDASRSPARASPEPEQ
eukprot:2777803-Rhodomonas_salina.2